MGIPHGIMVSPHTFSQVKIIICYIASADLTAVVFLIYSLWDDFQVELFWIT